ncbi:MAG TPA: sigma-54 dependent transcriptional regulator [Nitrospiraceae bacterium]|nr:sigma-54 dependent transcriptional regulator [Nitrospiraceae bacterium]
MATILVVDDEKNYLWMLEELFQTEGYEVLTCEEGSQALALLRDGRVDLLLTDLRMVEMDGLVLLTQALGIAPHVSTIIMTAYGTIERAVEAMRLGAYDFIVKPFNNAELLRAVAKGIERTVLVRENLRLSQSLAHQYRFDQLAGKSAAMQSVFDKIKRVTHSKNTVLITGESGSGKELVARAIHFNGPRCGRPFLAVNCSALTDTLAESELFGHERGAFTGASARHLGMFEQANGGTLFLDEIADLPMSLQAKLLRVLDNQEIRRVGSEKVIEVDVRILAATNQDLKAEVKNGRFREDLFFRLNVVRIDVPPLRERPEDIPLLAETYLQELVREGSAPGKRFSPATIDLLTRYRWPGNVRELQNAVAHSALMAKEEEIRPDDFPLELAASGEWLTALDRILPSNTSLDFTLKAIERHMIVRALACANGVQAKAAELLGISRSLLQYKLKALGTPQDNPPESTHHQ